MSYRDHFRTYGYAIIPQVYTDITPIQQALDSLVATEDTSIYYYYDAKPEQPTETVLTRIEHFLLESAVLNTLLWTPEIQAILTTVLGEDPVLFKDKLNFKLPGGTPDLLHQDQAAGWSAYADYFVSAAVFIDDNTRHNAAMSVLNTGDYPQSLMTDAWTLMQNPEPPFKPASDYRLLEGKAGDVVLFDSYIPHGSPSNTSLHPRRTAFITVNRASAGTFRDQYYADKCKTYPPNNRRDPMKQYRYIV